MQCIMGKLNVDLLYLGSDADRDLTYSCARFFKTDRFGMAASCNNPGCVRWLRSKVDVSKAADNDVEHLTVLRNHGNVFLCLHVTDCERADILAAATHSPPVLHWSDSSSSSSFHLVSVRTQK